MIIEDYSKEVEFSVGDRVHLELDEIPKKQRDVTTGVIIACKTRFPASPDLRSIRYTIRFDNKGNYVKEEYQVMGGIKFEFTCEGHRIRKI